MSHLSPFDPRLTDDQRAKVEAFAQQRVTEMNERFGQVEKLNDRLISEKLDFDIDDEAWLRAEFPSLTGRDDAAPIADQEEASLTAAHDLVDAYFSAYVPQKFWAFHLGADGLTGLGRFSGRSIMRRFRRVADETFEAYSKPDAFGDSTRDPNRSMTGFTVESENLPAVGTPDTRVYAVVPSWPFERRPVATLAELRSFCRDAQSHNFCDVRVGTPFCSGTDWAHAIVLPIVRLDVIICISLCSSCARKYRKSEGLGKGEIVDPDDVLD
ncbi:hypothetical protein [Mycobacterium kyogaense]|uniref:hypothetical protein n=1 Tax=Mycobacterium kyogaense TaxID=2212479 RepID=UPI000DACF5B5|nr:hypothetical protein [Mycobacterium kyogaense]